MFAVVLFSEASGGGRGPVPRAGGWGFRAASSSDPSACAATPVSDVGTNSTFIASAGTSELNRSWRRFSSRRPEDGGRAGRGATGPEPKTEYLNKKPPSGAKEFPVGDGSCERLEIGRSNRAKSLLMAKRGGGFNAASTAPIGEGFELPETTPTAA